MRNFIFESVASCILGGGPIGETTNNIIGSSFYSTISGGAMNVVTGSYYGLIVGGYANIVTNTGTENDGIGGDPGARSGGAILGGLKNYVGANGAFALGNFITNNEPYSIKFGQDTNAAALDRIGTLRARTLIAGNSTYPPPADTTNVLIGMRCPFQEFNGPYYWNVAEQAYTNVNSHFIWWDSSEAGTWILSTNKTFASLLYIQGGEPDRPIIVWKNIQEAEVDFKTVIRGSVVADSGVIFNGNIPWVTAGGVTNEVGWPNGTLSSELDGLWISIGGNWKKLAFDP